MSVIGILLQDIFHFKHHAFFPIYSSVHHSSVRICSGSDCSLLAFWSVFRWAQYNYGGKWWSPQLPSTGAGARWQLRVHRHARLRNKTHNVSSVDYSVPPFFRMNSKDVKRDAFFYIPKSLRWHFGQRLLCLSWRYSSLTSDFLGIYCLT